MFWLHYTVIKTTFKFNMQLKAFSSVQSQ